MSFLVYNVNFPGKLEKCTGILFNQDGSVKYTHLVHVSNFGGVAGSEDFACATLSTTPFEFQGKVENFCHPTLLKIRFKISSPLFEKGQSQNYDASINSNGLLTLSGLLSLKFLLHMRTSFIKENYFNNCI